MKVLITGAAGQLGQALTAMATSRGLAFVALDSAALDITCATAVDAAFDAQRPDVVINAAAYTAVDKAENDVERARAVNVDGPRHLAQACARQGAQLIHVSTDFVFDGQASQPYAPDAPCNPLGVYGQTKRDGEIAALTAWPERTTIVRTAWVYGPGGRNFVATMLRLMSERDELGVVMDQIGCPTCTIGLAEALLGLAAARAAEGQILHWTDAGVASWYDFAVAIRELAAQRWPDQAWAGVRPIYTQDYPTPASRPAYSVLDCRSAQEWLEPPRHWRATLQQILPTMRA
ncbi:dTDP-4-dehydrorhamnose reductase [Oceanococcus atlanticus]|uniref:dTDP-4-dehydrorhamnose reductase n=1 Tax=Oceanococcus atlanticus TaxID=1317117 RepID=A0A1Y1SIZ1_9GAMM|nr:dTDP-4-dehydrorhamnose reductase [Oceanococcus atlanticus]ORE89645.1 dTDP-4-dehydrorhamnose reductase [Oceanococcus atlanticus]